MVGLARRTWSITGAAVSFGAVASFATSAHADPPKNRIDWPSVPGCPDAKVAVAQAQRSIPPGAALDSVLARVEVEPPSASGESWRVHIRTRTPRGAGERTLEGESCAEVTRAAALLITLAAVRTNEPERTGELAEVMPPSDRTPEPDVLPLAKPLDLPPRAEPKAARSKADSRLGASVGMWVGAGLLPSLAWGPTLRGSYELRAWRVRVEAHAAVPQQKSIGSLGGTFDALGASLDLCRTIALALTASLTTRACAGLDVDAIRARGIGREADVAIRPAALPFVGVDFSWRPTRDTHVGLDLRGGPSVVRPLFAVETAGGVSTLHEPSPLRVEGALTAGFDF